MYFVLAISADSGEIRHNNAAFYLGFHCLTNINLWVSGLQRVSGSYSNVGV